jgi:threonine synthase
METHGELLTFPGILEVRYDYDKASQSFTKEALKARKRGLSKYRELLPLKSDQATISLGEGGTPLASCERLGRELGLRNLYIKNETSNPSGCFKDRETAIAINKSREYGCDTVACASTGSSAGSLATYASKGGLKCYCFVPDSAPRGKTVQILMHDARLFQVGSIYEGALKLEIEACRKYGWYNCSPPINPFRIEGDKTIAYEICEDLGWRVPDRVIVPSGGGGNLSGQWKGFGELNKLGLVSSRPRMTAVQVEAGASLAKAFSESKNEVIPVEVGPTVAGSILSAYADYGPLALRALRESEGGALIVGDGEILEAQRKIAAMEGIFAEPSASAAVAGLVKLVQENQVDRDEVVVCLVTGTGLREIDSAERSIDEPPHIDPSMEYLERVLANGGDRCIKT